MRNWNDFQVVIAIKEGRTLSAAARRLGLNQSTLSRALKRIEADLGQPLFLGEMGGYEPTEQGQRYYRAAKDIEKSAASLDVQSTAVGVRGRLRLTATETMVIFLLRQIKEFHAVFPGVAIELSASNDRVYLARREFHAALRFEREKNSKNLIVRKVAEVGIAAYQHRDAAGGVEWVRYESHLRDIPEEKWLRSHLKKQAHALAVSSYGAMELALTQNLGQGLLPIFMGDQNAQLRRVSGTRPVLNRALWFVCHPDFRSDPAMKVFAPWLVTLFEKHKAYLGGRRVE